ncbi:hypothetical protein FZX01_05465 [Listeria monocytogenes]|uniref:hypothetical protein n=1 Tax=Listeria monocytogenes TaxID=1639 RepID=UPI0010F36170|nr:hypothetical protein [Listeria monocytogenes]EAD0738621.1 hypothetical protein [Listeria monocytogenes]TYU88956.1 hypothetical protein FZX01_05465 [Listeria monocytogenes]
MDEEIPILNVESINIVANGDEPCYLGEILINGIAVRSGISEVRLNLKADKKPNVIIVADRNNIEPSVKKSWGII